MSQSPRTLRQKPLLIIGAVAVSVGTVCFCLAAIGILVLGRAAPITSVSADLPADVPTHFVPPDVPPHVPPHVMPSEQPPGYTPLDVPPHDVTVVIDPFGGEHKDPRSVWLLIVVDDTFTESDARKAARYYDAQYPYATTVFDAIFLCNDRAASEKALANWLDENFNPYVLYEYVHFRRSNRYPDPVFMTTDEITYGGTACQ